jgi:thioredoxin 2
VDVDAAPRLSARSGIQSIPTLMVVIDGRIAAQQTGAAPAAALRAWLDRSLASA